MITRQDFLKTGALGFAAAACGSSPVDGAAAKSGTKAGASSRTGRWFETAWRRAVIDMHIPDWDPAFLSAFNPDQYVDALVRSRAQSVVCYAHSHVGLFNYPTRVGRAHGGLKGRDIVAELIERCRRNGIAVVLYTSLIHDRWAFDEHPDWRMRHPNGGEYGTGGRYGFVCPNSPYREYVRSWVQELCERYEFDGIRFDMTFWVGPCYCDDCRKRWEREVGGDIPRTVDWQNPRWVTFQRKREEWLTDFAAVATGTVRELRPQATVEHQSSTYPLGWSNGVAYGLVEQNDFLQGDFYGDAIQGSFVRKLLSELTPSRPSGFETSFSTELRDHTGRKSEALLEAKASAAIADGNAFIFIDAIDPIGTVNLAVHDRMGRVFDRLMPYYGELGGNRVQDFAVYFSLESKFDMAVRGAPVDRVANASTHTESAMNATRWLLRGHLPFGIITRKTLLGGQLMGVKVLVLSGVHHMNDEECAAVRRFVADGGSIYASGGTSLVAPSGRRHADFKLADLFGVSIRRADWSAREHYVAPTERGRNVFGTWSEKYPAFVKGYGMEVEAHPGATVLATTTLPWPAPDRTKFSSIHSNPPWVPTKRPEVVLHPFGKGKSVYAASLIENVTGLEQTFIRLVRLLYSSCTFDATAPPCVELILFQQPERRRYLLSLINFQKELPNIPVEGITVTLRLPEKVLRIKLLTVGRLIPFASRGGAVIFSAPRLETLTMLAVEY